VCTRSIFNPTVAKEWGGIEDVVDKYSTLELEPGWWFLLGLLEDALLLGLVLLLLAQFQCLLAAKDDPLEQVHVILSLALVLDDHERVFEQKTSKGREVVALPIFDPRSQVLDSKLVVILSASLVDTIRDPLDDVETVLKFGVIRRRRVRRFYQLLFDDPPHQERVHTMKRDSSDTDLK
jgi:hypothetical protein